MWFKKKKSDDAHSDVATKEILNAEKENMIAGVEELSHTLVKEVMIPRTDIDFIALNCDVVTLLKSVRESGHSRFPVYDDSIDNVIGVLYVKDLIYALEDGLVAGGSPRTIEPNLPQTLDLKKIVRTPYFVPETKRIDSLLREFKRKHLHIALAIDEYGGIAGLITMEDIIEEIVGDIQDEFDDEQEAIVTVAPGITICDARADLDDLNEKLKATFPAEEFDSLGGFVFDLFGKIPERFEKISWGDFDFIVQDMAGHRINSIKIIQRTSEEKKDKE